MLFFQTNAPNPLALKNKTAAGSSGSGEVQYLLCVKVYTRYASALRIYREISGMSASASLGA